MDIDIVVLEIVVAFASVKVTNQKVLNLHLKTRSGK